MDRYLKVQ